tara:strand:+ start:306 stop:536 length:231 start_codon:yes stop_codon:yes gene_type:complete
LLLIVDQLVCIHHPVAKICDFGLAIRCSDEKSLKKVGENDPEKREAVEFGKTPRAMTECGSGAFKVCCAEMKMKRN